MKVSIVISIKDRVKHFARSLRLHQKQTMNKSDFEFIIVDDSSSEDIRACIANNAQGMNVRYISIDSRKNDFPIFWGPSISNNVGFKAASGEVIMITGPEILHKETNLEYAYESAMKGQAVFGHVLHSNAQFVRLMDMNQNMSEYSFDRLFTLPSSKVQDITKNTFYWFICAAKRDYVMKINGCDEEYMRGICGDDDDFINRIEAAGAPRAHDFRIVGIHQDHSEDDREDHKRIRRSAVWEEARIRNTKYLESWASERNSDPVANKNRDWGSNRVVISDEILMSA